MITNESNNTEDSTESLNGPQPSVSNLPANTEENESLDGSNSNLLVNTEAFKSSTRAQPLIPYSKNVGGKNVWRIRTIGSLAEKMLAN